MLQKTLHFAVGTVTVRVRSPYPERFLNLCSAHGIRFWDLKWVSEQEFTLCLTRGDYKRLRGLTGKLECTYRAEKRKGFVFFANRFRRRKVLLAGLAAVLLSTVMGSFFVWDFVVEGNETVAEEEILRALEECGVTYGTFGLAIDSKMLRNKMLLKLPELSYLAVNVSGSRAYVQVRERVAVPEIVDQETARNVVAAKSGLVTKVQAMAGQAAVLPGTTVQKGDILISGVADTDTVGARILAGMGSVTARTWYTFTAPIAKAAMQKQFLEEETRFSLVFGRKRINFYSNNSSIEVLAYDTISSRMRWIVPGGIALPVVWVREARRSYSPAEKELPAGEAQKLGEEILTEYLMTQLAPGGKVVSTLTSVREETDRYLVTLSAECLEEIGRSEEILHSLEE